MDKKKVLVVDDDPCILEVLKSGLELQGYSVETAENESNFRIALHQSRPDAILMDICIPGLDGISLCRDIRSSPDTSHIPIIILTAFSDVRTFHDAMLFGAADFLTKPFNLQDVSKRLGECIAKAREKKGSAK